MWDELLFQQRTGYFAKIIMINVWWCFGRNKRGIEEIWKILSHLFKCSRRNVILDRVLEVFKKLNFFETAHCVRIRKQYRSYVTWKRKKRLETFEKNWIVVARFIDRHKDTRDSVPLSDSYPHVDVTRPCEVYQVGQDLRSPDILADPTGSSQRSGKKNRSLHREPVKVEQRPWRLYYVQL